MDAKKKKQAQIMNVLNDKRFKMKGPEFSNINLVSNKQVKKKTSTNQLKKVQNIIG